MTSRRLASFISFLGITFFSLGAFSAPASPFRFHLINEPSSLKPWEQKSSAAGYFLSQVTGTLLTYQDRKLKGNLAEKCEFKNPKLIQCTLKKNLKWSDGTTLTAKDFERSFQEFINPVNRAFRADLLFPIQNARSIFSGKLTKDQLQVSAPKDSIFEIRLENPDSEFLYTLTSPLLAPIPELALPTVEEIRKDPSLWKSSGPYLISAWEAQKKISLKPNPQYWKKGARPELEVLSIVEDSVALNLYEKGELSFLRRLPTLFTPKYKGRPDYFEIEQIRFDYLGFSAKWKEARDLRLSLAQALRYTDLQKLFQAKGLPGCPGIPKHLHNQKVCHAFNLEKAKAALKKVNEKPRKLEVLYSRQGGDDHRRSMEWIQSEWQQNLGLSVDVTGLENKIFVDRLEKNPTDLFRKGIAPDRPTCLSALENFETGNSENYIKYSSSKFDQVIAKMRATSNSREKKKLCDQGLHLLMDDAWIIPTGPIHFTVLAAPQWKGWKLNELNQLDLSELKSAK